MPVINTKIENIMKYANYFPNCYRDYLLPFSHWIQSCQIPGNEKTVTTQRRSWMYTKTHLCTHVKKAIWSFWYWDWNIPRWKFHTRVAFCKHHQVISSRHVHDGMTILDKPQVWIIKCIPVFHGMNPHYLRHISLVRWKWNMFLCLFL